MKTITILTLLVSLLLIAGCTTPSSLSGPSGTNPPLPASADPLVQGKMLHQAANITLGSGNKTFNTWIDSIEVDPVQENGDQTVTIYVAAKNTGTDVMRMVWFSKLTDVNGKTYGGIKISHGGSGARTFWVAPNHTEMARDYVTVRSDRDLAALAKGAVLDVYYMNYISDNVSVSNVPDYHTSWKINPDAIVTSDSTT